MFAKNEEGWEETEHADWQTVSVKSAECTAFIYQSVISKGDLIHF